MRNKEELLPIFIEDFEVIIKRTSRKYGISLSIKEGKIVAFVSKQSTYSFIWKRLKDLIGKYKGEIKEELNKQQKEIALVKSNYQDKEYFYYLGKRYYLSIICQEKPSLILEDNSLRRKVIVSIPRLMRKEEKEGYIRKYINLWYLLKAKDILLERTYKYERIMGIKSSQIIIKDYKSKWGSCNDFKVICYNWRLVMSDLEIIDYVVVHELAHIIYRNHSKEFWNYVSSILKDYKELMKKLKRIEKSLLRF